MSLPDPTKYRISGFATDGSPVYHPNVFQQMILDGVIDRHGRMLKPAQPTWDYSKPTVICPQIGWFA